MSDGNGTAIAERPANAVAKRADANPAKQLQALLESRKDSIAAVLPKHLNADRLLKIALVAVSKNELLMKCSQTSILQSVMTAAQLGLDCGGALGSAYLVPFFDNKKSAYECQLVIGYRGLIDLARRSGQIVSIEARIVYEGDTFDLDYSIEGAKLTHKPCLDGDPGPMRLVYGVACLKDGGHQFELMTKAQIEKIKAISQTGKKNFGPWRDHYDEMARKTVVKRLAKYLPISVELTDAIDNDNKAEGFDPSLIVTQPDQTAKLNDRLSQARQTSAAALPEPIDVEPVSHDEAGEIPNDPAPDEAGPYTPPVGTSVGAFSSNAGGTTDVGAAGEAPKDEAQELDPEAVTWASFVKAAVEIAKARKVDADYFNEAMSKLKTSNTVSASARRAGHEFRSDWLGKFAQGAKLGTDGTLSTAK